MITKNAVMLMIQRGSFLVPLHILLCYFISNIYSKILVESMVNEISIVLGYYIRFLNGSNNVCSDLQYPKCNMTHLFLT